MNTTTKATLAAFASTAVVVTGVALGTTASASAATTSLSDKQLVALYEEERMAGDVYDALGAATGATIFDRIASSENRHQSAVAGLLEARGYDLSSLPTIAGDYATSGYDAMYTDFVNTGSASVDAAYGVGVAIEKADISDLNELLAQTDDATETRVLTALLNGSTHHLAAFSGEVTPGAGMQYGKGSGGQAGPNGTYPGRGGMGMQGQARGGMGMQGQAGGPGLQNRDGSCLTDGTAS